MASTAEGIKEETLPAGDSDSSAPRGSLSIRYDSFAAA